HILDRRGARIEEAGDFWLGCHGMFLLLLSGNQRASVDQIILIAFFCKHYFVMKSSFLRSLFRRRHRHGTRALPKQRHEDQRNGREDQPVDRLPAGGVQQCTSKEGRRSHSTDDQKIGCPCAFPRSASLWRSVTMAVAPIKPKFQPTP